MMRFIGKLNLALLLGHPICWEIRWIDCRKYVLCSIYAQNHKTSRQNGV